MGTSEKVSIILPTYNSARYLRESIDSCLNQTHANIELIVVDGGSTDETLSILESYTDPRIIIVRQADNVDRLPGALNLGFARASGNFFTWTQADDLFSPNALEKLLSHLMDNPQTGFAYASFWFINDAGEIIRESTLASAEALYWTNAIGHCFLYRRSVAELVGGYDINYLMSEDTHYWLRVYQHAQMSLIPGRYYYHRLHADSLTVKNYGAYRSLRVSAKARRDVLRLSWLKYQRQVAAAYIEEAFAAYRQSDFARVRRCVVSGLIRNPAWLINRGVSSIGLRSLIGLRATPNNQSS